MKRSLKKSLMFALIVAGVVTTVMFYTRRNTAAADPYRTAEIKTGDVVSLISATGTVEPEEVVDVGAQVAGMIKSFGKDRNGKPVDYGSVVSAGTVLARIDDSLYTSDVSQATASLVQARANEQRAEADVIQYQAKLDQAARDWDRAQKLGPSEALSQSSFDAYRAAHETAKANLAVAEATVAQTKGAVLQSEAALARARQNLGYCTIVSPVAGVIIDRRVNIGQTVVSSLNAPSLFLIAKDLKRMQVWVPVNEADIGGIHPGQPVTFTLDARPGETFDGRVGKVRLNAAMTQNVVNYTVEVITDNSSGKLLPYLTANVRFEVARHSNVLTVPNAALHWAPTWWAGEGRARTRPQGDQAGNVTTLWIRKGGALEPVHVHTGITDGVVTEVRGNGLGDGLEVVVAENQYGAAGRPEAAGTNPFTPQLPRGNRATKR